MKTLLAALAVVLLCNFAQAAFLPTVDEESLQDMATEWDRLEMLDCIANYAAWWEDLSREEIHDLSLIERSKMLKIFTNICKDAFQALYLRPAPAMEWE
jgi:hypothetical protein